MEGQKFHSNCMFRVSVGANLEYLLSPTNHSAKPADSTGLFSFLFFSLFSISSTYRGVHRRSGTAILAGKSAVKCTFNINRSLKTPWHKPSMELLSMAVMVSWKRPHWQRKWDSFFGRILVPRRGYFVILKTKDNVSGKLLNASNCKMKSESCRLM